jgi:hypothetical protein
MKMFLTMCYLMITSLIVRYLSFKGKSPAVHSGCCATRP